MIQKALLTRNLQGPITFQYNAYWWHMAQILRVHNEKLIKKHYLKCKFI